MRFWPNAACQRDVRACMILRWARNTATSPEVQATKTGDLRPVLVLLLMLMWTFDQMHWGSKFETVSTICEQKE